MSEFEVYEPKPYQEDQKKSELGESFTVDETYSQFLTDIQEKKKAVESIPEIRQPTIEEEYDSIFEAIGFGQKRQTFKKLNNLPTVYDEETGSKGIVGYNDQPNKELGLWYPKFKKDGEYTNALEADVHDYFKAPEDDLAKCDLCGMDIEPNESEMKRHLQSTHKISTESFATEHLCPICKDGMKCKSVTMHSRQWNTDNPRADESDYQSCGICEQLGGYFEGTTNELADHVISKHKGDWRKKLGNPSSNWNQKGFEEGDESFATEDITFGHQAMAQDRKYHEKCAICGKPAISHYGWSSLGQDKLDHTFQDQGLSDPYGSSWAKSSKEGNIYWEDVGTKKVVDKGSHFETEDGDTIYWNGQNARQAQSFLKSKSQENDLDYENTEFGSNKDGKIEPFEEKFESEDAEKSKTDEVNFSEELDMSSLYNSDVYSGELPVVQEKAVESFVDLSEQDKQGKAEESEIESKIINRKLNGYGEEAIIKELYIWHDMEREESTPLVRSVEVSPDDMAAYTLFGKRLHMLNAKELNELKVLSGSA